MKWRGQPGYAAPLVGPCCPGHATGGCRCRYRAAESQADFAVVALWWALKRRRILKSDASEETARPGGPLKGRNDPPIANGLDFHFAFHRAQLFWEAKGEGIARLEDFGDHVSTVYTWRAKSTAQDDDDNEGGRP